MKILLLLALSFITLCAQAQTFLFLDEHMSPFCKVMAPVMGIAVIGALGYVVVKAIRRKDDV
jgi:hypothetical protein